MALLTFGLFAGAALGAIVMAFLALAAYDHGYADAARRRDEWRTELRARRQADKADKNERSAA
jgi:hypothetical protein